MDVVSGLVRCAALRQNWPRVPRLLRRQPVVASGVECERLRLPVFALQWPANNIYPLIGTDKYSRLQGLQ